MLALSCVATLPLAAQSTTRVSVTASGQEFPSPGGRGCSLSGNGRHERLLGLANPDALEAVILPGTGLIRALDVPNGIDFGLRATIGG